MFSQNISLKIPLYFLNILSGLERKIVCVIGNRFGIHYVFKSIKMFVLKKLIVNGNKDFIDNDVTNIVCTRLDKNNKCDKAIYKLGLCSWRIFCISPKALVFCVLNNNVVMLKYIKYLGYPLDMIIYADNYHLVKKKCLENFVHNLDF